MQFNRGRKFSENEIDAMSYFGEFVEDRDDMLGIMKGCREHTSDLRRYFMQLGHEIPFRAIYKHKEKVKDNE